MPVDAVGALTAILQTIVGLVFGTGLVTLLFRHIFARMKIMETNEAGNKKELSDKITALDAKKIDISFCQRQSQECGRNFQRGEESFQNLHKEQQEIRKAQVHHGKQITTLLTKMDNLTYEVRKSGNGKGACQ